MVTKKWLNSSMHMDYLHISKIRSDKKKSIKSKSLKMSKFLEIRKNENKRQIYLIRLESVFEKKNNG
jgi:hypothetical protein